MAPEASCQATSTSSARVGTVDVGEGSVVGPGPRGQFSTCGQDPTRTEWVAGRSRRSYGGRVGSCLDSFVYESWSASPVNPPVLRPRFLVVSF